MNTPPEKENRADKFTSHSISVCIEQGGIMSFAKEIKDTMLKRKMELLKLGKETEKNLQDAPEGTLRISRSRGRTQYYLRKRPADKGGTYISKDKKELVVKLAQKDYDQKLSEAIRREVKAINSFLHDLPTIEAEQIYLELNEARRELVIPFIDSDEVYARRWQDMPFRGKTMNDQTPGFMTEKGERVRSKSEMIIANMLTKAGVPYRYECPLELKGVGTVYPDFTVLNVRLRKVFYWEHQGMMGDEEYAGKAIRKTASYQENGIFPGDQLILTSETKNRPIDVRQIQGLIRHYLL